MNSLKKATDDMTRLFIKYLRDIKVELEHEGYVPTIDLVIDKLEILLSPIVEMDKAYKDMDLFKGQELESDGFVSIEK